MADQLDDIIDDEEGKKSNKLLIVIVTLLIIIIWLAIFALLIKLDVGGFGSNVLRPVLKDVPIINMILPDASDEEIGLDSEYTYTSLSQAIARIQELEGTVATLQEAAQINAETMAELTAENARLKAFEQYQEEYVKLRRAYDEEVVFGDKAIDYEAYKEYYETVSPDNAAEIYEMVLERMAMDDVVTSLGKSFSTMKAAQAASILEEMTGDLEKVATILQSMNAANRGAILAAMDPTYAGKITLITYPTGYNDNR